MLRPFPQYNSVADPYGNVGNSHFNSLQVTLEVRRWHGLLWNVNYMYSRQVDDVGTIRTAYNLAAEKSVGANDQTHIFNSTFVYQVPLGKGHLGGGNPITRAILWMGDLRNHSLRERPAHRADPGRLQPPERGDLLRRLQPDLHRPRAHQWGLGRR
jgi:hypothetical protein